jgi:hypothetical protein
MIVLGANNYTLYENKICLLFEQRSEIQLTQNEKKISVCIDSKKEGFEKHPFENLYCKTVYLHELTNAFSSQTFAYYKNLKVRVFGNKRTPNEVFISTSDLQNAERLSFFNMGTYFGKDVKLIELDKIWEEYSPSPLNLPMPEGLPKERVLEIPRG